MRNRLLTTGGVCLTALFVLVVFLLLVAQIALAVFLVWKMVAALAAGKLIEGVAWGFGLLVLAALNRTGRSND